MVATKCRVCICFRHNTMCTHVCNWGCQGDMPVCVCVCVCVCVSVCLSVCLSVTTFSSTSRNKTAKKRYVWLHRYTSLILKLAIFVKVLRSKVMKKPTKYVLTATSYGADGAKKLRRKGLFWFFQSLTAGYKLPGQRATSRSAVQGFCFCSSSVYFPLHVR